MKMIMIYLKERKSSGRLEENENIRGRCILQTPSTIQQPQFNWLPCIKTFNTHLPQDTPRSFFDLIYK